MANWDLQLVSAIVRGQGGQPRDLFERAQQNGIRFTTFGSIEARNIWAEIDRFHARLDSFGQIPSETWLRDRNPSVQLADLTDGFNEACNKVKEGWARREMAKFMKEYEESADDNMASAMNTFFQKLGDLQDSARVNRDVRYRDVAVHETEEDLCRTRDNNGVTGMPFPWPKMNEATQGIQPGDFIMIWALPKSMKTWIGLIITAHLFALGQRVLIYSKEMRWDSIRNRINCLLAKVDYTEHKRGTLSEEDRARLRETVRKLSDPSFTGELFFTDADRLDGSPGGPREIRSKIDKYHPHFVLLDSSYMLEMPDAGSRALDWNQLALVSRQLKSIAKTTGVPMLAILQENERAAFKYNKSRGTASIAMNSGAVMDCDIGIRVVYKRSLNQISLHFAACRETTIKGFTINAIACTNFDYVSEELHAVGEEEDADKVTRPAPEMPAKPPERQKSTSLIPSFARGKGKPNPPDEVGRDLAEATR